MEIILNHTSTGSFPFSISSEKFSNRNELLRFYLYCLNTISKDLKALRSAYFEAKNGKFKDRN